LKKKRNERKQESRSVIPSFLSHSRSFLSHSFFLSHSPSSTPPVGPFFLLPLPAAQRAPEISGEPSCQAACRGCPIAAQIGSPNPLRPYPYPAAATLNPSAAAACSAAQSFLLHRGPAALLRPSPSQPPPELHLTARKLPKHFPRDPGPCTGRNLIGTRRR
jgi:hypothetical protein